MSVWTLRRGARTWLFEPGQRSERPPPSGHRLIPTAPSPNPHGPSVRRGGRETDSHFTHLDAPILSVGCPTCLCFSHPLTGLWLRGPRQGGGGPGSLNGHPSPILQAEGQAPLSSALGLDPPPGQMASSGACPPPSVPTMVLELECAICKNT